MRAARLGIIEKTTQKTYEWLHELMRRIDGETIHEAYVALRGVLHALRDRLPLEVAVKLGAQLPLLIRGIYYEGWRPSIVPQKIRTLQDFLNVVANQIGNDPFLSDTVEIVVQVFGLLADYLSFGEIEHIKAVLPHELNEFWPA